MTAIPPHDVLELPDHHLPLDLDDDVPAIRRLYQQAVRAAWDPETDIPWDQADPDRYTAAEREAGRVYWSRRAWGEYGAISESPAMQLRYVLEGREADLSLFWAIRTQEEVRHAEVCARMADVLGGYHLQPSDEELKAIAGALGTQRPGAGPRPPPRGHHRRARLCRRDRRLRRVPPTRTTRHRPRRRSRSSD